MRLKYLGTAAIEGIPGLFCECAICREAARRGGRDIRTRSQALVDDTLLIDLPPDTYLHYITHRFAISRVKACLITHSHTDHLYPQDLVNRKPCLSEIEGREPLVFYADQRAHDMLADFIAKNSMEADAMQNVLIAPYEPFDAAGYTVTAIRATHDPSSSPVVYIIEREGKALFYANDTSDFGEEAWAYLARWGKRFDLISLDCTEGASHIEYPGHMCVERCAAMRDRLAGLGLVDGETKCILNHFSHSGAHVLYDDLTPIAANSGFILSYDGMEVDF